MMPPRLARSAGRGGESDQCERAWYAAAGCAANVSRQNHTSGGVIAVSACARDLSVLVLWELRVLAVRSANGCCSGVVRDCACIGALRAVCARHMQPPALTRPVDTAARLDS